MPRPAIRTTRKEARITTGVITDLLREDPTLRRHSRYAKPCNDRHERHRMIGGKPRLKGIDAHALDDLRGSGLTDATILANDLRTTTDPTEIADILNRLPTDRCCKGGLVIPYRRADGTAVEFARVKPFDPRDGASGKPIKYEQPKGESVRAFFPVESIGPLKDETLPIFVTEGEKKALAMAQLGHAAIGLGGVECFTRKLADDSRQLIDDLAEVNWRGRRVYIVFDYDTKPETRRNVDRARRRLARELYRAGAAEVFEMTPTPGLGGTKAGIDDYLVGGSDFEGLTSSAMLIDGEEAEERTTTSNKKKRDGDDLIETLKTELELWVDRHGKPWATWMGRSGTVEHSPVSSGKFRNLLIKRSHRVTGKVPGKDFVSAIANLFAVEAEDSGLKFEAAVRAGTIDGETVYVDVADVSRTILKIDADGIEPVDPIEAPIRFYRPTQQQELLFATGGSPKNFIESLAEFYDLGENELLLLAAWAVAVFIPDRPCPMLSIRGGQGQGKSTLMTMLNRLVDPVNTDRRMAAKTDRDLFVAAAGNRLLTMDNLSSVSGDMSDALCQLITGATYSKRKNYSDDEEHSSTAMRPLVTTSIVDWAKQPDLLDRTLTIEVRLARRESERKLWKRFEQKRPLMTRGILELTSLALRHLPDVDVDGIDERVSRMADYTEVGIAIEEAVGGKAGSFVEAYAGQKNRDRLTSLSENPVFGALRKVMEYDAMLELTAEELWNRLSSRMMGRKPKGWPGNPRAVSYALNRLKPDLPLVGLEARQLSRGRDADRRKVWRITNQNPRTREGRTPGVPKNFGERCDVDSRKFS